MAFGVNVMYSVSRNIVVFCGYLIEKKIYCITKDMLSKIGDFFDEDTFDRVGLVIDDLFIILKNYMDVSKQKTKKFMKVGKSTINIMMVSYLLYKLIYMRFVTKETRYTIDVDLNFKIVVTVINCILLSQNVYRDIKGLKNKSK